ncbi:MAG TPA: hypothetical protein VEL76_24470, partial [Gemmataceae bacterium]|nr:hypothetical protein [Gemmataceae bacterium]
SPEQLQGKPVDQRTDIYSLGITCYEMLTGQPPFNGNTAFEIGLKHVREEPAPLETLRPGLPPAVCAIVHKMLAKDPGERYASARELLKDLAKAREALGDATVAIQAVPSADDTTEEEALPASPSLWQRLAARPWILALAGAGALMLVVLVIVLAASGPDGSGPDDAAKEREAEKIKLAEAAKQREEALKKKEHEEALQKLAEPHLTEKLPNPSGVDPCIDLGVFYLEEKKVGEAETLFKRMTADRRSPSAYYLVGRLGLAVVDAAKDHHSAAQDKFKELFNPKTKDNRVSILNGYLQKHPGFAQLVNEAESYVGYTAAGTPAPKTPRPPPGSFPFGKGKIRRP